MIDRERLLNEFLELVKIDSPSGKEERIVKVVKDKLEKLGGKVFVDRANNIVAKFNGSSRLNSLMLNAHLDTVSYEGEITPIIENGIVRSDGKTILGGDCKSGVAIILEVLKNLYAKGISASGEKKIPPLDIVFTVSEEIGLLGAKRLDYSLIDAKLGYSLDSDKIECVVTQAPSHNKILLKVYGKESHAGVKPENGISAIEVLSRAISKMQLGRIDNETTANIGIIRGGKATNIVPGYADVEGEVRSHDEEKLRNKTDEIIRIFKETANEFEKEIDGKIYSPKIDEKISREYNRFHISEDEEVVKRVFSAGKKLGLSMRTAKSNGGSDANIFNEKGIKTVILGTGMQKVHTNEEFIRIEDMVLSARLVLEMVKNAHK